MHRETKKTNPKIKHPFIQIILKHDDINNMGLQQN